MPVLGSAANCALREPPVATSTGGSTTGRIFIPLLLSLFFAACKAMRSCAHVCMHACLQGGIVPQPYSSSHSVSHHTSTNKRLEHSVSAPASLRCPAL